MHPAVQSTSEPPPWTPIAPPSGEFHGGLLAGFQRVQNLACLLLLYASGLEPTRDIGLARIVEAEEEMELAPMPRHDVVGALGCPAVALHFFVALGLPTESNRGVEKGDVLVDDQLQPTRVLLHDDHDRVDILLDQAVFGEKVCVCVSTALDVFLGRLRTGASQRGDQEEGWRGLPARQPRLRM